MERANQDRFGLAGIFDNVRDGLILVRFPQQEIVLFNRAASDLCGIPVGQAMEMRLDQVFADPRVHAVARRSSEQPVGLWPGHSQENLQTRLSGRHGRAERVELHFCRVEDVGQGGPLVLLVMRPSSEAELEAVAAEGLKAKRRLQELEEEAEAHILFFNEAAHELKIPLTIVSLQAELLALGRMDTGQERALSIINANIHRLVLLSQDLVDLARAEAGRLMADSVPVDLCKLARDEVANFEPLASRQGLALHLKVPDYPTMVAGDPTRLAQVLANLIGNALKFTPANGSIEVEVTATGQGVASVQVHDNGPGMEENDQARLFQPFVRIQSRGGPKKPGSGLGLHLSKRIVEAHGGTVGCSSPGAGEGMTFWFEVPLAAGPEVAEPGRRPPRPSGGRPASRARLAQRQDEAPEASSPAHEDEAPPPGPLSP